MALIRIAAFGALGLFPAIAWAQTVRGTVVAAVGRTPIPNAAVVATTARTTATTDRLGRFVLPMGSLPDTVVVAAIGWAPDTLVVTGAADLVIALERAPVVISDLIATAPKESALDLAGHGRWRMPMAAARTVPPAVEPDIYRALAMIPSVSFTSPLSARPLLRGYDAQEVTTRVDGFEVQNLFHLGRLFSSFPADATDEITVSSAPATSALGGSVAGIIDVTGRTGRYDGFHAGGSWSYGSLSGFAGGGNKNVRYFATGRVFYWKSLELIPRLEIPYHFEDLYAGAVFGPPERPRSRITVFATQDRAGGSTRADFLNWDNLLVGGRTRLLDRGATSLEVSAAATSVRQQGDAVPGLTSSEPADLRNHFGRYSLSADLTSVASRTRLAAGGQIGWRTITNRIGPASSGVFGDQLRFPRVDITSDRLELGAYLAVSRQLGPLAFEAAGRIDAAGSQVSVQPRIHARWAATPRIELSAGAGRASRLHHFLAESRSEPDFDFLDFWLGAGDSVPVARVDHLTIDANLDLAPFVARLSVYRSRGSGVGELRPSSDQRPGHFEFFRFGDSRTRGLEAQIAFRGGPSTPHSFSLSYVWAHSERSWEDDWVRWALDREHQLRGFGQYRLGRLTVFGALDYASGWYLTPATKFPGATAVPAGPPTPFGIPPIYGRENSAASSGTFRIDGGMALTFGGPRRSRFTLGASVINLLATAATPISFDGQGAVALDRAGRPTPFARLFNLVPIPTLTLRAEF